MVGEIAERIRLILDEKGIDHQELAERVGVDQSTAWRWVEGKRRPYKKYLQAIAIAYGYRPAWLISGQGGMYAEDDLADDERNALRNAGVIVRYADSGKIWFAVRFPDHMPVLNAHVVDVDRPGANNPESKPVKKGEKVG